MRHEQENFEDFNESPYENLDELLDDPKLQEFLEERKFLEPLSDNLIAEEMADRRLEDLKIFEKGGSNLLPKK